jgi:hypothetical protein
MPALFEAIAEYVIYKIIRKWSAFTNYWLV